MPTMRPLGRTSIQISPLVLGGNVFGWTADRQTSFSILDRFADAGFETIDTADAYSAWVPGHRGGESEEIIGEWMALRSRRHRTIVVTKVGSEMGPGQKGLSSGYIRTAIDASLRRLRTDYVDVYLTHWPDPSVPYEETLGAFQQLRETGKVREIGASNLDAGQLRTALDGAAANGLPRYGVLQPEYNLYDRSAFEGPLRELVIAEQIGTIPYYGLASGFLTGKYRTPADFSLSPRGGVMKKYLNERGLRILDALDEISGAHRATPAEVSLAWLMTRPGVTAPIASATSLQQLESLIRSASLTLSDADLTRLDTASRP